VISEWANKPTPDRTKHHNEDSSNV
jgi:hypothetical protein